MDNNKKTFVRLGNNHYVEVESIISYKLRENTGFSGFEGCELSITTKYGQEFKSHDESAVECYKTLNAYFNAFSLIGSPDCNEKLYHEDKAKITDIETKLKQKQSADNDK